MAALARGCSANQPSRQVESLLCPKSEIRWTMRSARLSALLPLPGWTKAEAHELDRKTEVERDDWTQVVSGGSKEAVRQIEAPEQPGLLGAPP
jgi:hypothetical protein